MELKELVKERVYFNSYRQGHFYYRVAHTDHDPIEEGIGLTYWYEFPVPLDDIGTATMLAEDKGILFMRWIRKSIEDKTLIKIVA